MVTEFLISGIVLGLYAGVSPGPLFTLVISETLLHGKKGGIKVALAPIITDIPIVLISYYIIKIFKELHLALGLISIIGGIFLIYLGLKNMNVKEIDLDKKNKSVSSLQKAVMVNALSPHPYLFWITVGGSYIARGNALPSFSFIFSFYFFLIGSKLLLVLVTEKGKEHLNSKYFILMIKITGGLLFIFAAILFKQGLAYFIFN